METIIYNAALERISANFPNGNLISLPDAAAYLGVDKRTLEARRDFPIIRLGNKPVVAKERLAFWLAVSEGKG